MDFIDLTYTERIANVCLKVAVICAAVAVSPVTRGRREEQEKILGIISLFINQRLPKMSSKAFVTLEDFKVVTLIS